MLNKLQLLGKLKEAKLDQGPLIAQALEIAIKAHQDQIRDPGGFPYLEDHIYPMVANILEHFREDPRLKTLITVGLLHDVLEDSAMTSDELKSAVGQEVTNLVVYLTKDPYENEPGLDQAERFRRNQIYLKRVEKAPEEAIIVKLEDRLQNLSCFDFERVQLAPEKAERYVKETQELFLPLAIQIPPNPDFQILLKSEIERITRILNR